MFYRSEKSLKFAVFTIISTLIVSGCLSGCAGGSLSALYRKDGTAAYPALDIIPEDFSFYLQADLSYNGRSNDPGERTGISALDIPSVNRIFSDSSSRFGIPESFLERTEKITVVSLDQGWGFLTAAGKYPDTLIKKTLEEDDSWLKKRYMRVSYYYSASNMITVIPVADDCYIACRSDYGNSEARAEKIIGMLYNARSSLRRHSGNSVIRMVLKTKNKALQGKFENLDLDSVLEIAAEVKTNSSSGGNMPAVDSGEPESFTIAVSLGLGDEKKAPILSTVIRLFLADYMRKNGIADLKSLREREMVKTEGSNIYVVIDRLSMDNLDMIISDFIISRS